MSATKQLTRKDFIKYALGTSASLMALPSFAQNNLLQEKGFTTLTILYTNDQHSRIEPFPENDAKYPNEGGFAKRATIIEEVRKQNKNVLLLDAGDIFQGTPYFNYYQGEVEYKLMSMMGYDATTFGNHDFDLGCGNIVKQQKHANFDFVNCNYNFSATDLAKNKKIKNYKIYKKGDLKIGVLGVGIDLNGLVDKRYTQGLEYLNPIEKANYYANILKNDEKCDYVVCLSHLGYTYSDKKVSDCVLAEETENIDLIIGGHTHTFLENLVEKKNKVGKMVQITQMGWAGIWLGKIEITFSSINKKLLQNNSPHKIN